MDLYSSIVKKIKDEMKKQGVSEDELCLKTGLDFVIIDKIMRGKNCRLSAVAYVPICNVLNISMDFLLGLSQKKRKN